MKFQTIYRCPVCKEVIDIHKHPEQVESGMAAAMLAGDGRRIHAKESPECTKHRDWIKGWITDPTTELPEESKKDCKCAGCAAGSCCLHENGEG